MKLLNSSRRFVLAHNRVLMIIVTFSFFLLFSAFSLQKYYSLNASAYDLGIFSQSMYFTLHGKLFYTNLLGMSYLQEHFSLIMFLILGLYAIHQSPVTLLILQSAVISLAGIPLYYLTLDQLRRTGRHDVSMYFSLLITVAYELSPLVESPVSFDFHLMAFLPLTYFMIFWSLGRKKWITHAFSLAFLMTIHLSFVYLIGATLIVEYYLMKGEWFPFLFSKVKPHVKKRGSLKYTGFIFFGIALSLVSYILLSVLRAHLFNYDLGSSISGPYSTGSISTSPVMIVIEAFREPAIAWTYLSSNSTYKLFFLILLFGTTSFLIFLSPIFLLLELPFFVFSLFSKYSAYYSLGYQYSVMYTAPVFISAAFGISKLLSKNGVLSKATFGRRLNFFKKPLKLKIIVVIIIVFMFVGLSLDPVAPSPIFHRTGNMYNYQDIGTTIATEEMAKVIKYIPNNATVLTQNNIFPVFWDYPNAYEAPGINSLKLNYTNMTFIVADFGSGWVNDGGNYSIANIIKITLASGKYGLFAEGKDIVVIKKGYSGNVMTL